MRDEEQEKGKRKSRQIHGSQKRRLNAFDRLPGSRETDRDRNDEDTQLGRVDQPLEQRDKLPARDGSKSVNRRNEGETDK